MGHEGAAWVMVMGRLTLPRMCDKRRNLAPLLLAFFSKSSRSMVHLKSNKHVMRRHGIACVSGHVHIRTDGCNI